MSIVDSKTMAQPSHGQFTPSFSPVMPPGELSDEDRIRFVEVEKKQTKLFEKLRKIKRTQNEAKAMECATLEQFAEFWKDFCEESHDSFERRHLAGLRRWARKYQNFGAKANTFMNDMKPILDVCKQISKPYSEAAIGIVGVFLVVASNKAKIEGKLVHAFESISDRLSGLKILSTCFNFDGDHERKLRRRILLAHLAFIDLAMEITKYYILPAYRRWSIATFESTRFQEMIDNVNEHVMDVRIICEELVTRNVTQMKDTIRTLQMGQATDHLACFLKLLGIPTWTPNQSREEMSRYWRRIEYEQWQEQGYDQMSKTRIEKFRQEGSFAQWSQRADSAMLILTGVNNTNIASIKFHCWISPIAIDAVERCRDEGAVYAFHTFCNDGSSRRSTSACLSVVAAQLLNARTQGLGGSQLTILSLAREISSLPDDGVDDATKVSAVGRLLCEIVKMFGDDEIIHIIIDRLDLCQESGRDDIPRIMVDVLNRSGCRVKVLLVTQWEYDWRINEREIKASLLPPNTLWLGSEIQGIAEYME
ncbi:hypothetical protein F4818DRAFT_399655 [Hypoxylon cercidicola]|nr:hypothetical protein F4818DRAFT_399655 [Hypoxylon cercidicola]